MKNIGNIDNILRVLLGMVLLSLIFIGPSTPWGWLGLVPLVTALISFCPIYRILGINTSRK